MRRPTNKRKDAAHFKRTAAKSKAVNLGNYVMRGGIRF